jgi:hypothetical protein
MSVTLPHYAPYPVDPSTDLRGKLRQRRSFCLHDTLEHLPIMAN